MKRCLLVAAALTLTSCAKWSKPGATTADFNRDRVQCQQEVIASHPVVLKSQGDMGQSQTACQRNSVQMTCDTTPVLIKTDSNAWGRKSAMASCLQERGYSRQ